MATRQFNRSAWMKALWHDPEYRREQSERMKQQSKARRRRHSIFMKAYWRTLAPKAKTRQTAAMHAAPRLYPTGPDHPSWKGGRTLKHGYVAVLITPGRHVPGGPARQRHEHTVIAEQALGRRLRRGEVVHHIDGNKTNNAHDNLIIMPAGYHRWLHARLEQRTPEGRAKVSRDRSKAGHASQAKRRAIQRAEGSRQ